MGILQQYDLMAGPAIFADSSSGPKPQRNSGGGFGGFTYSGDNAWKAWATPIDKRTGALNDEELDAGAGDLTYGPKAFGRLAASQTTLLTNLAEGIGEMSTNETSEGIKVEWSTEGYGAEMKNTFTSGDQMRSMQIKTLLPNGRPLASGGTIVGYDKRRPYHINNWNDVGGNAAAELTAREGGLKFSGEGGLFDMLDDLEKQGAAVWQTQDEADDAGRELYDYEFTGIEGGASEVFGGTRNINMGLRALPGMKGTAGLG